MQRTLDGEVLRSDGLEVRPGEYLAIADGRVLALSLRELAVLAELLRNHGRIVPREELYERVWGRPLRREDRSVDVYVHRLRRKLTTALPDRTCIHTHFGFGYRLEVERSHPFHISATTS